MFELQCLLRLADPAHQTGLSCHQGCWRSTCARPSVCVSVGSLSSPWCGEASLAWSWSLTWLALTSAAQSAIRIKSFSWLLLANNMMMSSKHKHKQLGASKQELLAANNNNTQTERMESARRDLLSGRMLHLRARCAFQLASATCMHCANSI